MRELRQVSRENGVNVRFHWPWRMPPSRAANCLPALAWNSSKPKCFGKRIYVDAFQAV